MEPIKQIVNGEKRKGGFVDIELAGLLNQLKTMLV